MSRRRPVLKSALGKVAVSGVAGLATVLAVAPVATAADDLAPTEADENLPPVEVDEPEGDATEAGPAAEDETPAPPADDVESAPAADDVDDEEPDTGAADEAEADDESPIEPEYGFQKFRVGVKLADGVTVPEGVSTAGSTITLSSEQLGTITCTTEAAGPGETTSYCPGDDLGPVARLQQRIGAAAIEERDPETGEGGGYLVFPGDRVTMTMTSAPDGLVVDRETVVLEPCEAEEGIPVCLDGEDIRQTRVLFEARLPGRDAPGAPADPADPGTDTDPANVALPDTGGSDVALLGLGTSLVGVGAWLAAGRRRPSVHALAD